MTAHANVAPPTTNDVIAVITAFLKDRLEENYSHQSAREWISKRAREAWQIKEVTHVLKYTHPDAKCDVRAFAQHLRSPGNLKAVDTLVGTHSIDIKPNLDAAGNAAALPVYGLLRQRVGTESILDLAGRNDEALKNAFDHFGNDSEFWIQAFASCAHLQEKKASHKLAKQVYWPLDGGEYHLLAPLFPTSLVHGLWQTVREDRFSEEAKAARAARKAGVAHPHGFREYPDLAIQSFGGTKPQNISQLNSERYGENYLLRSLPPNWQSPAIRPPATVNSVFDRIFSRRKRVRELLDILRAFLESVVKENNVRIRNKRAELTAYLCDEALLYAAELREAVETGQLAAGWTQDAACKLNRAEQCWLDPLRCDIDPDFAREYQRDEWPDEICRRFGNWLNARLNTERTPMGAIEAEHWRGELEKEMRLLRRELANHD